jgi:hypothetical protein
MGVRAGRQDGPSGVVDHARTVQSQPSLKLGDTRFQGRDLGRLRLDQCGQFFPRWLAWRLRIHESLNRNEIPLSRKISGSTVKKCRPYLGSDDFFEIGRSVVKVATEATARYRSLRAA